MLLCDQAEGCGCHTLYLKPTYGIVVAMSAPHTDPGTIFTCIFENTFVYDTPLTVCHGFRWPRSREVLPEFFPHHDGHFYVRCMFWNAAWGEV